MSGQNLYVAGGWQNGEFRCMWEFGIHASATSATAVAADGIYMNSWHEHLDIQLDPLLHDLEFCMIWNTVLRGAVFGQVLPGTLAAGVAKSSANHMGLLCVFGHHHR